jgi:hypothetical protein
MTEQNATTEERARCCVRHEDLGGPCREPFAVEVYGLAFCERHGEEIRTGAAVEEREEVYNFFERFRNPHVRGLSSAVEHALAAALERTYPTPDKAHWEALRRLYPDTTEHVRGMIARWEADENPDYAGPLDALLLSLNTVHTCIRIAYQDVETWLTEALELERESLAAQAAVALEHAAERQAEREAARG